MRKSMTSFGGMPTDSQTIFLRKHRQLVLQILDKQSREQRALLIR
ncbi:MAG: hypothetical protein QGH82_05970 [Candidatus Woesearchaeota archaeon]|nr:hypothetical protein [Candidatus Woesearchaeota archaeon]